MPLSTPVDTNPIVKEPPVFQDGVSLPSNIDDGGFDASGSGAFSGACDVENDEFHIVNSGSSGTVTVYDALSGSSTRSYSIDPLTMAYEECGATFRNDHFYVIDWASGSEEIRKIDPSTGNTVDTVSSFPVNQPFGISFDDSGNLLILSFSSGEPIVSVMDGFSSTELERHNLSGATGTRSTLNAGISVTNGNLVLVISDPFELYVFDGVGATALRSKSLSNIGPDNGARTVTALTTRKSGKDGQVCIIANSNDLQAGNGRDVVQLGNADNGVNFTGNSGKTLETDHIYSFDIVGPNTTTGPTINDDGQGAFGIVLPGGASIPVGALTGNFDFLFDGSNYVVVSLTSELAAAIYDFQGAVKDNMTATTDPTVNDDADAGYSVRSRWYNTSSGEAFLCVDPSAGAAVWVKASLTLDELGSAATEDAANPATANTVALRDANGRAQFADPSADADAATKGWALAAPGTSTDPALAFDTWRTPNANRPTLLYVHASVQTDGTSDGDVRFDSDESGGTSANYTSQFAFIDAETGPGSFGVGTVSVIIPAGGSYRLNNASDPNNNNAINEHREFTL